MKNDCLGVVVKPCLKCGSADRYASGVCKRCMKIATAKNYAKNKEKINARHKEWNKNHPEERKLIDKRWKEKNPEKVRITQKKWSDAHRDVKKELYAKWVANNPEKRKAINNKYDAANREKRNMQSKAWAKANPEKCRIIKQNKRAKKRANGGKLSSGLALKLFTLQRGKCACCRKPLGDDYHLDHIMPLALGGANEDWNMQLLTSTCNQQKYAKHPVDFMQSRGFLL